MSGHADDWPRVKEIFAAALNLPPEARASYLASTCGGDDQLRAQVQGLLDSHERAGSFLETSQEPPNDPQSPRLRLEGQRIGAYEVVARLGAGGMGEVYRARDLRLGRDVAIKILPEVFTRDPERLARFEREARVLAALTHPNIGAIYGVEDPAPGSGRLTTPALLLELIEGDTLAERIARSTRDSGFGRQRGLPMAEAVKIAAQIADALEAAHDKGIIHRDLKPANIKITPAGVVKVLDFGLAKAALDDDTASPDLSQSPTMTSDGTRAGMILGTAAYMSPEQARGHVVDKRTDIWAFGCVLYEMLAGRATFPGATVSDTIAAILERNPEWSALPSDTPESVGHLIRRCLEKDARQRLRDIGEARIELLNTAKVLEPVRPDQSRRAVPIPPRFAIWATAAVVLAVAAAGIIVWTQRPGAGGRKRDFPDAERLVKRLVAQELTLSFVPDAEQRLWRTVMRRKYQITRSRVQLHNRLESLLEEAHIKVSSVVSDLLGTSARRMLHAVGNGETDPAALAALADQRLRATPEQLRDAFGACADLHPVYRRLVKLTLDELRLIEDHLAQLDQQMAQLA